MPIFSYRCLDCFDKNSSQEKSEEYEFDLIVRRDSSNVPVCPKCGSKNLKKIFTPSNTVILFRGDGFYSTDNKKGDNLDV